MQWVLQKQPKCYCFNSQDFKMATLGQHKATRCALPVCTSLCAWGVFMRILFAYPRRAGFTYKECLKTLSEILIYRWASIWKHANYIIVTTLRFAVALSHFKTPYTKIVAHASNSSHGIVTTINTVNSKRHVQWNLLKFIVTIFTAVQAY